MFMTQPSDPQQFTFKKVVKSEDVLLGDRVEAARIDEYLGHFALVLGGGPAQGDIVRVQQQGSIALRYDQLMVPIAATFHFSGQCVRGLSL
jgi:hypothetical protein